MMSYLALGIIGHSSNVEVGSKPRPRKTIPFSAAMVFIWCKWLWVSAQVSVRVLRGAPLSSSCPPGSRVTLWPSSFAPIILSLSMIGAHEKSAQSLFSMCCISA